MSHGKILHSECIYAALEKSSENQSTIILFEIIPGLVSNNWVNENDVLSKDTRKKIRVNASMVQSVSSYHVKSLNCNKTAATTRLLTRLTAHLLPNLILQPMKKSQSESFVLSWDWIGIQSISRGV